ncbi:hypothetical protein CANINC_002713 [Pichia inconspicua]|uniref:Structural maintenance of chromosomes protein n=1 Tax=Pichia inconspicua TaxID=52247 RepID=A0A4V4NFM6_9ASCO|nr:hypothetical protein CANINC_002713 [[Candida] inconspicua]
MGRLVGLELNNFKSYKGVTRVGFGTANFTSIIGPNGAGKSNMMDAISFVLGVRSNQLRSKNIKSLIYRGRIDDSDEEDEDALELELDSEDPDSAYVIAIYEKENKEILNLKRQINSNGSSSFIVNDVQVSVNQYLQILKEENILIKAKNFLVFQGDVEKVASQSPLDLTKMIETISGSINLKKQFEDLKEEKEKAHDITALKNSQKRNLKDEIKTLKAKCFEADLFDKKIKQLDKLIINKFLSKLEYCQRMYDNYNENLNSKNDEITKLQSNLELKQQEYKDFIKSQSDEHMSIKEYENKIESDEARLKELKTNIIPLESEVSQLHAKVSDYDQRIEQLKLETSEQQNVVNDTTQVLKSVQIAYDLFVSQKDEHAKSTTSFTSNVEMLTEYNKLRNEFLSIAGTLESEIHNLNDDKLNYTTEIESLKASSNIISARIQDLDSKRQSLEGKKSQLEKSISANELSVKNFKKELNSLDSLRHSIKEKELKLNEELKSVLLRLNEINAVQRENKKERRLRETCATLKKLFPNVRGLLNDFVKPKQRKYSVAVATILGRNFDSIIVDTIATATECIDYMKEQRLGVASFIPLDTVKVQPLDSNLRNVSPGAVPIIDIISYPVEFEKAVQYVCGNSLVCDTIELATSLRWGRKINVKLVTLDGALIHKSGLMTGGGNESFSTKWDKSELGLLTERKEELKMQISEIHSKNVDDMKDRVIAEEIMRLETNSEDLQRKLIDVNRNLRDVVVELEHENKQLDELSSKVSRFEELINDIDVKIDTKMVDLKKSQHQIYDEFCSTYGFNNIEEYEVNHSARIIKESKEQARFTKEIQRLENKVKFETERLTDYQLHLEKLEKDKSVFYQSWKNLTDELVKLEDEIDDLQSSLDVTKEDYNKLKKKAKQLLSKSSEMETSINSLKAEIKQIKKDIANFEENIDAVKSEYRTQLVTAKLENVKIPLLSGSLDMIPLEDGSIEQEELSQEWNNLLNELEIDYSKLDNDYRVFIEGIDMDESDEGNTLEFVEEKCKSEIEKLQNEVHEMHPDIHAREHLQTAQERLEEIDAEFMEARRAEKEIVNNFEKVKEERHHIFMKAFEHVSNSIDDVYKELTKSRASPMGGSAYLILEDEDEPFSFGIKYHIMPPLKRFKDMENLSGGEKTIGALALLFAVHSYHPSPFFVLDEVDAALDNANVNRIANYISKHRGPGFQFIVISLKNSLFERSDSLVGIYRDQDINSSKILTVNLREYTETV